MKRSIVVLSVVCAMSRVRAQTPVGCYRFDRPLGISASGDAERGDSSWYKVQLEAGGAVARTELSNPHMREYYARRSAWRISGDSLFVRVFTGLVGWDLTLLPFGGRYVGTARYLSDAIGGPPVVVRVQGAREACGVASSGR